MEQQTAAAKRPASAPAPGPAPQKRPRGSPQPESTISPAQAVRNALDGNLKAKIAAKLAAKNEAAQRTPAELHDPSRLATRAPTLSKYADAIAESSRRARADNASDPPDAQAPATATATAAAAAAAIAAASESRRNLMAIPVAPVSSLKINQKVDKERKMRRVFKVDTKEIAASQDPEKNPFFDARVKPSAPTRKIKPGFNFVQSGSIISKAQRMREQAALEVVQAELREAATKRVEEAKILALIQEDPPPEPPGIEWWDAPFLHEDSKDYASLESENILFDRVTSLVHHPVPVLLPRSQKDGPVAIPLMLTKKEQMKMRHQNRVEKQKEAQEMVQMGLEPPPPNKVKLSNFMRVLANEASQDPTKIEAEVRRQVEGRRREHEQTNEARKKTKEERRQQQTKLADKDREEGLFAAVYRVSSFDDPRKRFKVDINAQQCNLTGTIVLHRSCNVVVVEGGVKAQKKFKKLMLRRIDWGEPISADGRATDAGPEPPNSQPSTAAGQPKNTCVLVWEGEIPKPTFKGFKIVPLPTEDQARSFFRKRRCEQFWDLCRTLPVADKTVGIRALRE